MQCALGLIVLLLSRFFFGDLVSGFFGSTQKPDSYKSNLLHLSQELFLLLGVFFVGFKLQNASRWLSECTVSYACGLRGYCHI